MPTPDALKAQHERLALSGELRRIASGAGLYSDIFSPEENRWKKRPFTNPWVGAIILAHALQCDGHDQAQTRRARASLGAFLARTRFQVSLSSLGYALQQAQELLQPLDHESAVKKIENNPTLKKLDGETRTRIARELFELAQRTVTKLENQT